MIRLMLVATLVTGCTSNLAPAQAPVVPPARATPSPSAPAVTQPISAELQSIVNKALADAARRTQRAESSLQVISAESVTWPDGSLGCPSPGGMYTMALVPGYQIRIQAGAQMLDYHANRDGQLLLCPTGRAVEPRKDDWK